MTTHYFCIAEHLIKIVFQESPYNSMRLLASFQPFNVNDDDNDKTPLFTITIDDTTMPVDKTLRERIRDFDTGNGDTIVDRITTGGYQFIVKDLNAKPCALLVANEDFSDVHCALNGNFDMRRFGLNNVMMLTYAFAGSLHDTLLIHASLVRHQGYGYAFIAKSGTGKSTHTSLWMRYIPDCDLMNDDNPVVRVIDGKPYIYGSPWSGKTPCYRNVKAPLGAITRIDRAPANSIERLRPVEAFTSVLPSCSSMKWDKRLYRSLGDTITRIIETTPIYILHCLPDKEAAEICHKEITRQTR